MKDRFGKISLWKFLFSIMIIIFHVGNVLDYNKFRFNFRSGSIAVDFFFVVSGFFFCRKYINYEIKKSLGEDSFNYLVNRTSRFIKNMAMSQLAIDIILRLIMRYRYLISLFG